MVRTAIHRISVGWLCFLAAAVAALADGPVVDRQVARHAAVGETIKLGGHVNYHPCGSVIPTTIVVFVPPSHGTLGA
jgi:hypothetical protein